MLEVVDWVFVTWINIAVNQCRILTIQGWEDDKIWENANVLCEFGFEKLCTYFSLFNVYYLIFVGITNFVFITTFLI